MSTEGSLNGLRAENGKKGGRAGVLVPLLPQTSHVSCATHPRQRGRSDKSYTNLLVRGWISECSVGCPKLIQHLLLLRRIPATSKAGYHSFPIPAIQCLTKRILLHPNPARHSRSFAALSLFPFGTEFKAIRGRSIPGLATSPALDERNNRPLSMFLVQDVLLPSPGWCQALDVA